MKEDQRNHSNLIACVLLTIVAGLPEWALAGKPKHGNFLPVTFEETTGDLLGFTHGSNGGESLTGIAWLDYNNDGWLDFYVANGIDHNDGLMRNNHDGTFSNVIVEAGLADGNGSSGVVAADLNNDGHVDLIVTGETSAIINAPSARSIRVFRNNGDGRFSDVTALSGVAIPSGPGVAFQPVLGDIDKDSYLDLFVTAPGSLPAQRQLANHLFKNNGDFTFTDISAGSGVDYALGACSAAFSHYDNDDLIDLYVSDCGEITLKTNTLRLFQNNGDLTFTELTADVGLDTRTEGAPSPTGRGYWMCTGLGDYDNDADFDLFATNFGQFIPGFPNQESGFFERNTNGTFTSVETEVGIGDVAPHWGWGCSFDDFNNDGWVDLIFAGNLPGVNQIGEFGNPGYLFVNEGNKTFRNEGLPVDLSHKYSSGVATADYNNDGFVDIVVSNGSYADDPNPTPTLLKNKRNHNHWITIRLVGTTSNRSAVGARVQVELPGRLLTKEVRAGSSFLSQNSPWLTFGLNKNRRAHKIKVTWPSGEVEEFKHVRGRRTVTIVEGRGIQGHYSLEQ